MPFRLPMVLLVVTMTMVLASGSAAWAQEAGGTCRFFPETEHYVCGVFLDFFDARGGLEIFGYPLTGSCHDPGHTGLRVQYFQRARMELHPDAPPAYRVQLGLLADELGYVFPPVHEDRIPRANTALHHYFPETQHIVSYAFLDYFREHGGIDIFGYPRSEFMYEAGRVVQYFQRAKMVWHPESALGSRIKLSDLGEEYLERFDPPADCDRLDIVPGGRTDALATVAASSDCRYFEETRHYVCDDFLDFFDTRGSLKIFGYPLTEAFADPTRGQIRVQYFQRARMELPPSEAGDQQVQLGLLGDELGRTFPPISEERIPPPGDDTRRYFPETGHTVEHIFLDFFRENGGLTIFGYPRSSMTFEDGDVVQYFQRARMVWDRDGQSGAPIKLTNLGEIYVERVGIPGGHADPVPPARHRLTGDPAAGQTTTRSAVQLKASASVRHPVVGMQSPQSLYVYLENQRGEPVEGAVVTALLRYASGHDSFQLPATDARGFTQLTFETRASVPGQRVIIDVTAVYNDATATVQTFFVPSH